MNKILFVVLLTVVFALSPISALCQSQQLHFAKIEFEGFYTETFVDISCERFESVFKETKKIQLVNNQDDLFKFKLLTKHFKSAKYRPIDVRGTITYHYEKVADKYCFDVFGYFYKDGQLYYNKNLLIAISDQIYNNHPKYLDTLRQQ